VIAADPEQGRQFGIMFAVSAVVYGLLFMPIVHPDMNYIPKNIHDLNRELLFKSRRTMYCFLQLIFVFVLGGTSISLFYDTWYIGVGVVVGLFAAFVIIDIVVYFLEIKKYLAIPAPEAKTEENAPQDEAK
jgi:hypothetical protein